MKRLISRKEYEEYVESLPKDKCPFCDKGKQIVLGESKYWYWVANISPYWKWHTLLVPRRHEVDMDDLSKEEMMDYKSLHKGIIKHLLSLKLKHDDGTSVDQFITMIRTRVGGIEGGSKYYKPNHLHVHVIPDKDGIGRFNLDEKAINVDIDKLKLN